MDMGRMFSLVAIFFLSLGASAASIVSDVPFISSDNLGSLISLQVRDDGNYDVICKDRTKEVATSVQLMLGKICPAGAIRTSHFISIQIAQDGKYSVICQDQTHHLSTGEEISKGQVCMVEVPPPGTSLGKLNGHEFFKVQTKGTMTDTNVIAACKANGYEAPCNDLPNGTFSDDKCFNAGLRDGYNPLQTIAGVVCKNTSPSSCAPMNGVFQYMGQKWQSGSSCGILNGTWCTEGRNVQDQFALCVSAN